MCTTCGCGSDEIRVEGEVQDLAGHHADGAAFGHDHSAAPFHQHGDQHGAHAHTAEPAAARLLRIEQDILAHNDAHAARNRRALQRRGIFALNLVSSPGAGKTALLEKTIRALADRFDISVIEGDQQTSLDAERIRATGARAVQINTGKACHLDAHTVGHALAQLDPPQDGIVVIENVGNLVCPAAFDLGEAHKVVVLSVTEGEDKPLKYPDMFRRASLMLLNKIDLLPHLEFDYERCLANARRINPEVVIVGVSAATGAGIPGWLAWLEQGAARARAGRLGSAAPDESHALELEPVRSGSRVG